MTSSHAPFVAILIGIAVLIMMNGIALIRIVSRDAAGKSSANERRKYVAASCDRLATAFLIAAFVTPQTNLSALDINVTHETKVVLVGVIWILGAGVLHLSGSIVLAGIKD